MDTNAMYDAMLKAMQDSRHVAARKCALELWHWLCRGGDDPSPATRAEVDASIRGVMLATEYLEEYEDWDEDEDDEEDGGRQLELF